MQQLTKKANAAGLTWITPKNREAHFVGEGSSEYNALHKNLTRELHKAQGRLEQWLDKKDPSRVKKRLERELNVPWEAKYWTAHDHNDLQDESMTRHARDLYFLFPDEAAERKLIQDSKEQADRWLVDAIAMFPANFWMTEVELQQLLLRKRRVSPLLPLDKIKQLLEQEIHLYSDGRRNKLLDMVLAKIEIDRPARAQKRAEDLKAGKEIIERRAVGRLTEMEGEILCGTRCYHFPSRKVKQTVTEEMTWDQLKAMDAAEGDRQVPYGTSRLATPIYDGDKKTDRLKLTYTTIVEQTIHCDCEGLRNGENFLGKMPTRSKRALTEGAVLDTYHYDMQVALVKLCGTIQSWGDVNVLLSVDE